MMKLNGERPNFTPTFLYQLQQLFSVECQGIMPSVKLLRTKNRADVWVTCICIRQE